jgi:CubicO group peptidase (beta-lactamase class C family)
MPAMRPATSDTAALLSRAAVPVLVLESALERAQDLRASTWHPPTLDMLEPLGITSYYMNLSPLGDVYFGGGHAIRTRDFLKFGQLYLNGGTWGGRRIMSQEWVTRSIAPRYTIGRANYLNYGYLWWSREYAYLGRTVRVYSALGNGGQVVMFIPELDLVIATTGGNYSDPTTTLMTDELIPRYILPAVLPDR